MLTRMTEEDWATVLEVFRACRSRRGAKGRNDRIFLEALHYFAVHNITWRAPSTWGGAWRRRSGGVGGRHDTRSQVTLRRLPLSGRGHQPRGLALLSLSPEPSQRG